MAEILFGQSYYLRFDPKLWQAMQPYPPLGALYAASCLRGRGYDVALFDAMLAESEIEWAKTLVRQRPKYAVLFEDNFNYLSKMCLLRMRQAAFAMCRMAKEQNCTIIVCGSDATDHAAAYFAQGADFVLMGEGEITLGELLDHLTGRVHTALEQISGLAWPDGHGGEIRTIPRPVIQDLEALPFPAWDLVDVSRYQKIWRQRHGYFSMNMVTTRGCPYHCNWCAKPIWGQRYNVRSPENVVAELLWLKETFHPDHIWFADDIMGLKPGWLQRFADLVEEKNAHVPFKSLNRADLLLRAGDIEALQRAGCRNVWIGAESGSQKILDAMEKGTRVEQICEVTRRLHTAGIQVGFFLQFGYPGETREDIELTMKMIRDCQPDDIGVSVSYPLPGTKFFERIKDQLGDKQNWTDSDDLAMLYQGPFTTAFYRQLYKVVHKEFRARKYWVALKRLARHPSEFNRKHPRQMAAMIHNASTLPIARHRLNWLEKQPHSSFGIITPSLSQVAAAIPSPQPRHGHYSEEKGCKVK
jgi:anaerobic magnesium-protoporphyrin IX monomethyl ester cyclase